MRVSISLRRQCRACHSADFWNRLLASEFPLSLGGVARVTELIEFWVNCRRRASRAQKGNPKKGTRAAQASWLDNFKGIRSSPTNQLNAKRPLNSESFLSLQA